MEIMERNNIFLEDDLEIKELLVEIHQLQGFKIDIISDFVGVMRQIDNKPSDEIETNLQKIVHKIRPYIHQV